MKIQGQKTGNEKGVTIVALAVTIIVLLILASISIAMLSGNHGLVEMASDSQIETELSQLQQSLNRYKISGEDERIGNGDYSGEMTNDDLINAGIIKKVHIKNPDMMIGIIYLDKIGVTSNLGNNAKNVTEDEIENFSDLYDVFIIDLNTNDIYYVKNEDYWIREGEAEGDKDSTETEGEPTISVTPSTYVGEGSTDVVISVAKGEAELASDNEYEYYLSSSSYDLQRGKWTSYTSGTAQTIGNNLNGEYYIYVKQVEDQNGKLSTGGKIVIIRGEKYHRFGKFVFEKGESEEYKIAYNLNGGTVTGNPTMYTRETETFTLNNPTRLGYEFLGWTGSNGSIPQKTVTIEKGSTGNRVYEANWNINRYTVTYNYAENGGTEASKTSASVAYGAAIDLTPTATKAGYEFVGWNTNKDATTKLSSLTMTTSNVTLYAIYSKTVTATFNYYNKESEDVSGKMYNKETTVNIKAPDITDTASVNGVTYNMRGWTATDVGNASIVLANNGTIALSANTTYYASYTYTVTLSYDANSDTGAPVSQSGTAYMNYAGTKIGAKLTISSTKPARTGYTFLTWNTNSNGTETSYSPSGSIELVTNVTLYAIWKDTTPPAIGTLTLSPTGWTNQNVTLTGKASDLGSGISYYQFSTNGNLTSSSSGWISITNTTKEITQTYSVASNGTYYFYVKDVAGNVTKKSVIINKIDKNVPTIDSLTATANSDSTFKLVINASDTGGSGLKTAYVTVSGTTMTYSLSGATNTIEISDAKQSMTYSVYVVDNAGNKSSTKTVSTYVINYNINNTYWTTTLNEAISKASNGNIIKLVNNYTDTSSVIFNKNVTLNLNNKTLTRTGTTEPIQISSGANVTFTGGTIVSNSVEYDSCIIDNNGTLIIESGTYKSTSNQTRVLLNRGTLTMNGGTLLLTRDGWTIENRNIFNFNAGTISLQDNSGGTALYNSAGTTHMTGGTVTSISYGLCVNGGSFKSTEGAIQKTGTVGSAALVRNTGSAYMYNTYVTSESASVGRLENQTGKYNNLIYVYTEDHNDYLSTVKGTNVGKVFYTNFMNNGDVFVSYYNTGYSNGNLAVWTTKDSQDDLEWMAPYYIQNQDLGFAFKKSNHKGENGVYRLHLYANGTSTFIEGIDIDVP